MMSGSLSEFIDLTGSAQLELDTSKSIGGSVLEANLFDLLQEPMEISSDEASDTSSYKPADSRRGQQWMSFGEEKRGLMQQAEDQTAAVDYAGRVADAQSCHSIASENAAGEPARSDAVGSLPGRGEPLVTAAAAQSDRAPITETGVIVPTPSKQTSRAGGSKTCATTPPANEQPESVKRGLPDSSPGREDTGCKTSGQDLKASLSLSRPTENTQVLEPAAVRSGTQGECLNEPQDEPADESQEILHDGLQEALQTAKQTTPANNTEGDIAIPDLLAPDTASEANEAGGESGPENLPVKIPMPSVLQATVSKTRHRSKRGMLPSSSRRQAVSAKYVVSHEDRNLAKTPPGNNDRDNQAPISSASCEQSEADEPRPKRRRTRRGAGNAVARVKRPSTPRPFEGFIDQEREIPRPSPSASGSGDGHATPSTGRSGGESSGSPAKRTRPGRCSQARHQRAQCSFSDSESTTEVRITADESESQGRASMNDVRRSPDRSCNAGLAQVLASGSEADSQSSTPFSSDSDDETHIPPPDCSEDEVDSPALKHTIFQGHDWRPTPFPLQFRPEAAVLSIRRVYGPGRPSYRVEIEEWQNTAHLQKGEVISSRTIYGQENKDGQVQYLIKRTTTLRGLQAEIQERCYTLLRESLI